MQIGYVNKAKRGDAVLLCAADFLKAGNYSVAKEKMSILSSFFDYFLFIAWIGFGISYLQDSIFFEDEAAFPLEEVFDCCSAFCASFSFAKSNAFLFLPSIK